MSHSEIHIGPTFSSLLCVYVSLLSFHCSLVFIINPPHPPQHTQNLLKYLKLKHNNTYETKFSLHQFSCSLHPLIQAKLGHIKQKQLRLKYRFCSEIQRQRFN